MALELRLQRLGNRNRPYFQLVATDSRNARDGRFIERLGYYDPTREPSTIVLNEERIRFWWDKGAVISATAKRLFKDKKMNLGPRLSGPKRATGSKKTGGVKKAPAAKPKTTAKKKAE